MVQWTQTQSLPESTSGSVISAKVDSTSYLLGVFNKNKSNICVKSAEAHFDRLLQ